MTVEQRAPGIVEGIEAHRWRRLLVVAVLALLPYLSLPGYPFLVDAPLAVTENRAVRDGPPGAVFATDFWGHPLDAEYGTGSYRPLVSLSYALQLRLAGPAPWSYHLVDIGLHALAAMLALLLAETLGLRPRWALACGALFALHPVASEAVASVVGRADLMAAIFLLAALVLHLNARRRARSGAWNLLALAALAAALLCKEYAVAFPFIVVVVDLAVERARPEGEPARARPWRFWLAAFGLLVAYLALRFALIGSLGGVRMLTAADHPLYDAPLPLRWAMAARLYLLAGRLLILPLGLNYHYRYGTLPVVDGLFDPRVLGGIVLLAALLAVALGLLRRYRTPAPLVGFALFLLPPLPALNTVSLSGMVFAERFLYLPACGLALLAAWAMDRFARGRRATLATLAALSVILVLLGGATAWRVLDWGSTERLARSSLREYPGGAEVWLELGLDLGRQARHEESAAAIERSLELQPQHPRNWQSYGVALVNLGRFDEGAAAWRRSIELTPQDNGALWRGLGQAELLAGNRDEGILALRKARELLPGDPRATILLARQLLGEGRADEAVVALRAGLAVAPETKASLAPLLGQALLRLGQQRLAEGNPAAATELAGEAVSLGALPADGLYLAGLLAARAERGDLARAWIDDALAADPDLLRRKHQAALRAESEGRLLDAASAFGEILAADPSHAASLFNLGRLLLRLGRTEEAIRVLERGLEVREDPRARELLVQALRELEAAPVGGDPSVE